MKNSIKKVASTVIFLSILIMIFVYISNVFRPSEGYDRTHIIGFENQKDLDVVYIGGSACFVFWQPLRAWNDCGFTSYNYATNGLEATSIKYLVKNAEKEMSPELYVIGVRPFQLWSDVGSAGALRYVTDSWSVFSYNRLSLINSFFDNHKREDDKISYIFDIANYHSNQEALGSQANWNYKSVHEECPDLGWEWIDLYQYLEPPRGYETEDRADLDENNKATLVNLCEYCKKNQLNVLFVVCPYYIEKEDQKAYNSINDIVASYGFDFLNANEYYEEIGIDFSKDFYNKRHVNCFGAEKYTVFLEQYIKEHYEVADHRGENGYEMWDEEYARFIKEESTHKKTILTHMESDLEGIERAQELQKTNSIAEWYLLTKAEPERYTLLIYDNRNDREDSDIAFSEIQKQWKISFDTQAFYILANDLLVDSSKIFRELSAEGNVGKDSPENGVPYRVSMNSLMVNGHEYWTDNNGLTVVAVDNNLWSVADCIYIEKGIEGEYTLKR